MDSDVIRLELDKNTQDSANLRQAAILNVAERHISSQNHLCWIAKFGEDNLKHRRATASRPRRVSVWRL